jgi:hypothetical protein
MTTDRYKLHQFYHGKGSESNYLNVQEFTDEAYKATNYRLLLWPWIYLERHLNKGKK